MFSIRILRCWRIATHKIWVKLSNAVIYCKHCCLSVIAAQIFANCLSNDSYIVWGLRIHVWLLHMQTQHTSSTISTSCKTCHTHQIVCWSVTVSHGFLNWQVCFCIPKNICLFDLIYLSIASITYAMSVCLNLRHDMSMLKQLVQGCFATESTQQVCTHNHRIKDPMCYRTDPSVLFSSACTCGKMHIYKVSALTEKQSWL